MSQAPDFTKGGFRRLAVRFGLADAARSRRLSKERVGLAVTHSDAHRDGSIGPLLDTGGDALASSNPYSHTKRPADPGRCDTTVEIP